MLTLYMFQCFDGLCIICKLCKFIIHKQNNILSYKNKNKISYMYCI